MLRRLLTRLLAGALLVLLALGAASVWWLQQPLNPGPETLELAIEPGTTPREVARLAVAAGAHSDARLLYAWFRLSGQDRRIKAGNYEIPPGTTPRSLLLKLVRGEETLLAFTLVEGWNFRQVRAALARAEQLKPDSANLSDEALMARLGRPGVAPEGRFFPDTYTYAKGSSDLAILRRALHAMDRQLAATWAQRAPDLPLTSPDEALILASLVEKETGLAADRARIAGVFINRLRAGMLLQTDPSVIYGLGTAFDGNLRRRDLLADTPWNTYTRPGLPPTPIAMPGKAALLAAVQPERTRALYFVARGDGSSEFNESLDAHARAVRRYQRGQ
ncbi:endolytic transglycosylase MltG [Extensimonas perlucida]|uniref:endolytic transglycosylase MltG n=1 Tax=Extensimonas perlucida TaxID=2590786 RepID=UPI00119DB2B3|nr:endolytic transglycosylase MltG [Extensimonas perlucida]